MQAFTTTDRTSARDALRFGRQVAAVELVATATVTDPGRPLALVGAGVAVAVTANTILLGASWLPALLTFIASALGWLALVWLLTCCAEARAFRRAAATWRYENVSGATAVALRTADRPTGGWLLQSMAARPRGSGAGTQLIRGICAEADAAGAVIALVAVTNRAADWYTRFGFQRVRKTLPLGQWRLERQPEQPPLRGGATCKVP